MISSTRRAPISGTPCLLYQDWIACSVSQSGLGKADVDGHVLIEAKLVFDFAQRYFPSLLQIAESLNDRPHEGALLLGTLIFGDGLDNRDAAPPSSQQHRPV